MSNTFRFYFICFTFLTFVFSLKVYGQRKPVYALTDTMTYVISADSHQLSSINMNYLVRDIAVGEEKRVSDVQIKFHFQYDLTIFDEGNGDCSASVFIKPLSFDGAEYKDFDISEAIVPSGADISVRVVGPMNQALRDVTLTAVPISENFMQKFHTGWLGARELQFYITQFIYDYDNAAYEGFRENILQINNYYAALSLIDQTENLIEKSFFRENNSSFTNYLQYLELKSIIRYIDAQGFDKLIELQLNDPGNFTGRFGYLKRQGRRFTTLINAELLQTKAICDEGHSYHYWAAQYYNMKYHYFDQMSELDHEHRLFFENLVSFDDFNGFPGREKERLQALESGCNINLTEFYNVLFSYLLNKAEYYIEQDDHSKSLIILHKLQTICQAIPGKSCPALLYEKIEDTRKGIYDSFIEISRRAYSYQNYDMAAQYLDKSLEFINGNHDVLEVLSEDAGLVDSLLHGFYNEGMRLCLQKDYERGLFAFTRLFQIYEQFGSDGGLLIDTLKHEVWNFSYQDKIDQADREIMAKHLAEAELLLSQANEIEKKYPGVIKHDYRAEVAYQEIYRTRYKMAVDDGKNYMTENQYEKASYMFLIAKYMEDEYGLNAENKLDSLLKSTGSTRINSLILRTDSLILNERYEEGFESLAELRLEQQRFGFMSDMFLINRIIIMQEKLHNGLCTDLAVKFRELVNGADLLLQNNLYVEALGFLNEAIEMAEDDIYCGLDISSAIEKQQLLEPALAYLRNRIAIDSLALKDPEQFVSSYLELSDFWQQHHLSELGIENPGLKEYSMNINSEGLYFYLLNYYINDEKYRDALEFLQLLFSMKTSVEKVKEQQEELGMRLAELDYPENKDKNPHYLINEYTSNYKWYRHFRTTFLETWEQWSLIIR